MQIELTDEERAFVVLAVHSFTTLTPSLRGLFQKVELTKKLGIESMEDFQAFSDRVLAKLTS